MAITKIQSESLNLADDYAFTGTITGAGGVNSDIFFATNSSSQTFTHNVKTKVQFNSEVLDTGSNYDPSTNYRYTVPSDGKYFFYSQVKMQGNVGLFSLGHLNMTLNGSDKVRHVFYDGGGGGQGHHTNNVTAILDLSANDYLEVFYQTNNNSNNATMASTTHYENIFMGYKMNT